MPTILEVSHDIDAFAPDWPSLAHPGGHSHHVFQSADVLKIWQRTIGAARRIIPCYVRVSDISGQTLMLIPLGIEERHGVRVLVALDGGVSDYNGPIVFDGAKNITTRHLHRELRLALPRFDAVLLEKSPARIGGFQNPLLGDHAIPATCGYEIDLTSDWTSYVSTQLHRPKDSRRKRRRLAELGDVRFLIANTEAERERLFAALIQQKSQRYLKKNGVDGFDRPGYRAYFTEMTRQLHPRGFVQLSALEVGGKLVATHWGLVTKRRFYCLMLAFADCRAAAYSPASILVEELIQWSFSKGIAVFDLGFGHAAWKLKFGARRCTLLQYEQAISPVGWAYLNARRLRERMPLLQPSALSRVAFRAPSPAPAEGV